MFVLYNASKAAHNMTGAQFVFAVIVGIVIAIVIFAVMDIIDKHNNK